MRFFNSRMVLGFETKHLTLQVIPQLKTTSVSRYGDRAGDITKNGELDAPGQVLQSIH